MDFSPPSLHPPVVVSPHHRAEVRAQLGAIAAERGQLVERAAAAALTADAFAIPLTAVSMNGTFDAYMDVSFKGQKPRSATHLQVDSGNSMLIVPRWEDIAAIRGWRTNYTVLGTAREPWGSPANVVRGPIRIPTANGQVYTLENCVFYACTGAPRTANFGAGCITPWSASGWNVPPNAGVTMQAPLAYNSAYPFAEFSYAPAATMFAAANTLRVSTGSSLLMYRSQPAGYDMFDIVPDLEWMSLIAQGLSIGATVTEWPGTVSSPIAVVDTGGGPVTVSDPNGYVYARQWPGPATCPFWTSGSVDCHCVSDAVTLKLGDATKSTSLTIDTSSLPPSVQGLTLVMCRISEYMRGQQGMNIGGISALFNHVLVDYANARVGLKPR